MAKKSAPILVLQHHAALPLGALADPLTSEGSELHTYHHGHHEPPDPELADAFGAIISLGGSQSANDAEDDPFLSRELEILRVAVREEVPVLGIGLGANLLARAAGGTVRPDPHGPVIGWRKVHCVPRAKGEPLLKGWNPEETVFHAHQEIFDLPRDARLLLMVMAGLGTERSERRAFVHGVTQVGLIFHIEVDARSADAWASRPDNAALLPLARTTLLEISNDSLVHARRLSALAQTLGRRFALLAKGLRPDQSGPIRI